MLRKCFEAEHEGRTATLGLYEHKGEEVLKAWGYKDEEHCSYHSIKAHGAWSDVIEGCPDFNVLTTDGKVTGFTLRHNKLHSWNNGVYEEKEIKECCSTQASVCHPQDKDTFRQTFDTYFPLILTATLCLFMGAVTSFLTTQTTYDFMMYSMGYFITIIGALKVRDVRSFSRMFARYDPLAKLVPMYGYTYPFLETALGLLILLKLFMVPVHVLIVTVYTLTTVGIIISLHRKQNLDCGCLGEGFKLPLSKVTIFENVIMIGMAIFTLYGHYTAEIAHTMVMYL